MKNKANHKRKTFHESQFLWVTVETAKMCWQQLGFVTIFRPASYLVIQSPNYHTSGLNFLILFKHLHICKMSKIDIKLIDWSTLLEICYSFHGLSKPNELYKDDFVTKSHQYWTWLICSDATWMNEFSKIFKVLERLKNPVVHLQCTRTKVKRVNARNLYYHLWWHLFS